MQVRSASRGSSGSAAGGEVRNSVIGSVAAQTSLRSGRFDHLSKLVYYRVATTRVGGREVDFKIFEIF